MAKKKKKERAKPAPPKKEGLNTPFAGLKKALAKSDAKPLERRAGAAEPAQKKERPEEDEQAAFLRAMADVDPLAPRKRAKAPITGDVRRPRLDAGIDEELEVMAQLADLVDGLGDFDIRYSDQYVQGAGEGVGPDLMERLAQGSFPVQDYLDLHGLGWDDALSQVEAFLIQCAATGLRHVLIVHGKGNRSPEGVPVLKNGLVKKLGQKRLRKRILGFCTAQPRDGGEGAMYVLLRKWSGPGSPRW